MDEQHADENLAKLESESRLLGGFSEEVVRSYRKKLWFLRQAVDERDLYAMKSLHFEKLNGERQHQRSIRLNKQWRLILEITEASKTEKTVRVIRIEDYH